MNTPVLLALTGNDDEILRALNATGSGLTVVRRCADLTELLAAGIAGLGRVVVVEDTFDLIDRSDLERLQRAGLATLMLCSQEDEERWQGLGAVTELRETEPAQICARVQQLANTQPEDRDQSQPAELDPTITDASHTVPPAPAPPAMNTFPAAEEEPSGDSKVSGRILALWGPPGAPGRSTLAAALAHALSTQGPTILVDADVEAPCQVQLLGVMEDSSGLASAARLANHRRLDSESLHRLLTPVHENLGLLSGMGRAGRWRELSPAAMAELWAVCRGTADWTVVDLAAGMEAEQVDEFSLEPGRYAMAAGLLEQADSVIVVGSADPVGIHRLVHFLADLSSLVTLTGKQHLVVNRVRSSAAGPAAEQAVREAVRRFSGVEELTLIPDNQAVVDRCVLEGRTIFEGAPGSEIARALAALAQEISPQAGRQMKLLRPGFWERVRQRARGQSTPDTDSDSAEEDVPAPTAESTDESRIDQISQARLGGRHRL